MASREERLAPQQRRARTYGKQPSAPKPALPQTTTMTTPPRRDREDRPTVPRATGKPGSPYPASRRSSRPAPSADLSRPGGGPDVISAGRKRKISETQSSVSQEKSEERRRTLQSVRRKETVMGRIAPPAAVLPTRSAAETSVPTKSRKTLQSVNKVAAKPKVAPLAKRPRPPKVEDDAETLEVLPRPSPTARPRKRLIDTLADQAQGSLSSGEDERDDEQSELAAAPASRATARYGIPNRTSRMIPTHAPVSVLGRESTTSPARAPDLASHPSRRAGEAQRTPGHKYTYSRQHVLQAEKRSEVRVSSSQPPSHLVPELDDLLPMTPSAPRVDDFAMGGDEEEEEEEEEPPPQGALRSVHELRRAGANHRFADETDDLMDRIGVVQSSSISPTRRYALLEFAQKLQQRDFVKRISDHGFRDDIFASIPEETDEISSFLALSILVTLLASPSAARIPNLMGSGVSKVVSFLGRLLEKEEDICQVASRRKTGLSRNGQANVSDLRKSLLSLVSWPGGTPKELSARMLALQFLRLSADTYGASQYADLVAPITVTLFAFLESSPVLSGIAEWDSKVPAAEVLLSLTVLEHYSRLAVESGGQPHWETHYPPIAAKLLGRALESQAEPFGQFESLVLKLSVNITNNNASASGVLAQQSLLRGLASAVCRRFDALYGAQAGAQLGQIYGDLMLMINVMINICEHCVSAGCYFFDNGDNVDPSLERLVATFLSQHESMTEADSEEETQLNVALGFLSVLLGYICLHELAKRLYVEKSPDGTLVSLLGGIRQFMDAYQKADDDRPVKEQLRRKLSALIEDLQGS